MNDLMNVSERSDDRCGRHGISRALIKANPTCARSQEGGFLTRNTRMKERKIATSGCPSRSQFSKR